VSDLFSLLDVEGFPILRDWYAVYPAGRELSVVARAFLDYLLGRGRRHLPQRARTGVDDWQNGCRAEPSATFSGERNRGLRII
jgi:hypothetical protein